MKHLFILLFSPLLFSVNAQNSPLNVQQIAHVPTSSFQVPTDLSDIWGWVDDQGNEYAIVGTNEGTSIFDLSNPAVPTEIFFEQGMTSVWRDIKTYGDYAYVTTEAYNGLLIIDMTPLPDSSNLTTYYYTGPSNAPWHKAHNLFIDDRGYAYIFGANRGVKGCIILDLNQDPTQPVEVADINNWYVHDGMVKGDTLYLANVSNGFFTIWDVSVPSNPVMIGQHGTLGAFCHNAWVSDDGDYLYTTDEITDGYIGEYDISDLNNISLTDQIQAEPGQGVIPHNTHFLNDYLITSYYTSGVVVQDVSRKGNMVEVGSFDTSPNFSGNGFYGCWGVYPWLPSGLIIASDIEEGFYVLSPTYKRGAYLEGTVKDASSNHPINGATVEILSANESSVTSTSGEFAMGVVNASSYNVVFSHPLYQNDTAYHVVLQNDSVTTLNTLLYSLTPLDITIQTKQASNSNPLSNVSFVLENNNFSYSGTTSSSGSFVINNVIPGSYNFYAGLWGYESVCEEGLSVISSAQPLVFQFEEGYKDDFNLDLGWVVDASALSGVWERDAPNLTLFGQDTCNAAFDSDDCGDKAYITGNLGGFATSDDVDFGYVKLSSPTISLDPNEVHYLHCSIWWKNMGGGTPPDDSLKITLNDGNSAEDIFVATQSVQYQWLDTVFLIPNAIDLTDFKIEISTADWISGVDHLVEAGFDNFHINNSPTNINISIEEEAIIIYPNPTNNGLLNISGLNSSMRYELYNLSGKIVGLGTSTTIKLDNRGVYLLKIIVGNKQYVRKVIY